MVYLILTGLYVYVILKAGLQFVAKQRLKFLQNYRLRFAEIIIFALILGYTFNYFYFRQTEFNEFIVSRTLLWIAFVASTLLLGIGIGMRFATETLQSVLSKGNEQIFKETKKIHDVFSQIWINLSVAFLFFIYCIMEISKAGNSHLELYEILIIYGLSVGFGILYSLQHRTQHPLLRKASLLIFTMLGICLFTFIVESNVNFVSDLPISTSYFIFIVLFVAFTIFDITHKRVLPREAREALAKEVPESAPQPLNVQAPEEPAKEITKPEYTVVSDDEKYERIKPAVQHIATPELLASVNEEVNEDIAEADEQTEDVSPTGKILSLKSLKK